MLEDTIPPLHDRSALSGMEKRGGHVRLDEHVVQCCAHSTRADGVGVARAPANLDCVSCDCELAEAGCVNDEVDLTERER
jgi:hypothetical protein